MSTLRHRTAALLAAATLALSLTTTAHAKFTYADAWRNLYPSSLSLDNVEQGTGTTCQLCHEGPSGGEPWNAYGWAVRENIINGGMTIQDALLAVEGLDSDTDPSGSTNLDEILADTQPGWTEGNHNTIHYKNGSTIDDQPPPTGILGELDPAACAPFFYCGVAQNPANSATIAIDTCDSSAPAIFVTMANAPANQFTYLLIGDGMGTIHQPPGASGDLCIVGGSCLGRYDKDVQSSGATGTASVDILHPLSAPCGGGVVIAPGQTWNFQYWHRRPMGTPASFSEAMSVTFQ